MDDESYELIDIVFDGPPGLQAGAGRFVEVEDGAGRSIKVGEWIKKPNDGYWRLRIRARQFRQERDTNDELASLNDDPLHDSETNGEIGWFFDPRLVRQDW